MSAGVKSFNCSEDDIAELLRIASSGEEGSRMSNRARMVLLCHEGVRVADVSRRLNESQRAVIKWRDQYIQKGIEGLYDSPRNPKASEDRTKDKERILTLIKEEPPHGKESWEAEELADKAGVSVHKVWRILKEEGISLSRNRTWYVEVNTPQVTRTVGIVGLYLSDRVEAVVLEAGNGRDREIVEGILQSRKKETAECLLADKEESHPIELIEALRVAAEHTAANKGSFNRKEIRVYDYLDFLFRDLKPAESAEYHVLLSNKADGDDDGTWIARHRDVYLYSAESIEGWLDQVAVFFNIMTPKTSRGALPTRVEELTKAIMEYLEANQHSKSEPFMWRLRTAQ